VLHLSVCVEVIIVNSSLFKLGMLVILQLSLKVMHMHLMFSVLKAMHWSSIVGFFLGVKVHTLTNHCCCHCFSAITCCLLNA